MIMTTMGFQKPPAWNFRGRGLYQLHLVKAEVIRPFIPTEFRIVETLGYTMGGFMLSSYEDSPHGPFDELVMIPGIVSHSGSPLAWTGKVLVSSDEVCEYSRKDFGIATEVANFSKREKTTGGFLNINGIGTNCYKDIQITETNDSSNCITIQTPAEAAVANSISSFILSPPIKLSLTGLSGLTEYNPRLLQYTCNFETRLRVVATANVSNKFASKRAKLESSEVLKSESQVETSNMRNLMIDIVMKSTPILAFEFDSMKMAVDSPTVVS